MKIHLHVKFRAFGFTFGEFDRVIAPPFVIPVMRPQVLIHERGILLEII